MVIGRTRGLVALLLGAACTPNVGTLFADRDAAPSDARADAAVDSAADADASSSDVGAGDAAGADVVGFDDVRLDAAPDVAGSDAGLDAAGLDVPGVDVVVAPVDSGREDVGSPCAYGAMLCGSSCVETPTDPANCGSCGNACGAGTFCAAGLCAPTPSTPAPALPAGRIAPVAVTLSDGRALVAGGNGGPSVGALRTTEIYDPATNRWVVGPMLPAPTYYATAVRGRDGVVYVFGGTDDTGRLATAYALDAAATSWRAVAAMPSARAGAQSAVGRDGRVYVMGGWQGVGAPTYSATVDVYDPAADRWSTGTPLTEVRAFGCATTLSDGRIALFGGVNADGGAGTLSSVQFYDPTSERWTAGPSMPTALQNMGCARASDGLVHFVAGLSGTTLVGTHLAFDPVAGTYRPLAAPPAPLRDLFPLVESPRGTLLAVGGRLGGGPVATAVSSYAIASGAWR